MGRTKPITVQYTGAPKGSILAGTSDHNKGLLIQVEREQERIGKRVCGPFTVLRAGRGRYASVLRQFEGQQFDSATEFIKAAQDAGAEKCTHAVNRNCTAVMDPDTSMSLADVLSADTNSEDTVQYDAFISHASEDKDAFVRPLADALIARKRRIWYDELVLRVGASLRRSIDTGLRQSRFGIIVLSHAFFSKPWPQYELDGLVAREMSSGKVILPIWHNVTQADILNYSPSLADKLALESRSQSVEQLAQILDEALE